jgi:hypothetical protein
MHYGIWKLRKTPVHEIGGIFRCPPPLITDKILLGEIDAV